MRISGLASGIDTETMIKQLMDAERIPLNKFKQQKQTLEWKRDAFRELNTSLLSFKDKLNSMKYTTNYRARTLLSSDETKVSAKVSSGATLSTYSISNVDKLASSASLVSGKMQTKKTEEAFDPKKKLSEQLDNFPEEGMKFTIKTHTLKGEKDQEFTVTKDDTLQTVMNRVNESDLGVTMFYDSFTNKVSITRNETGKFNTAKVEYEGEISPDIEILDDPDNFMSNILGFGNSNGGEDSEKPTYIDGQNAIFTVNGLQTERPSNTFVMNGVTFTLKETFDEAVSFTVGNDTEAVMDNIKGFVTQYNELIEQINGKLNEQVNRSYQPLTDEEKESLSEKQIEKWEDLAKSGLLKRDPILMNVLSTMRMDFSSKVETGGEFQMLSSIGITTTRDYLSGGKLEINEEKLREAIEKDPDAVERLFRNSGEGAEKGLVHRLSDTVDVAIEKIRNQAGRATSTNQQFSIGKQMIDIDKSIERFEAKLEMTERRYWNQFTAMERAIQRANEQANYLMSQFMSQ